MKDCLETYLDNINIYTDIAMEYGTDVVSQDVANNISNIAIRRNAVDLLETMTKFGKAMDKLQSDYCR